MPFHILMQNFHPGSWLRRSGVWRRLGDEVLQSCGCPWQSGKGAFVSLRNQWEIDIYSLKNVLIPNCNKMYNLHSNLFCIYDRLLFLFARPIDNLSLQMWVDWAFSMARPRPRPAAWDSKTFLNVGRRSRRFLWYPLYFRLLYHLFFSFCSSC